VDNSNLPITPADKLHTTGNPPPVDISSYHLEVGGLVDHPLSLSYDEFKSLPTVTETVLLICPAFFVDNAQWTGVPVASLLKSAGVQARANKVTFIGLDGYREMLPIDDVQNEGVFLAYSVNGQALPVEQGFPLRLVLKGRLGDLWVKWVQSIQVG
jgi:DMSO/TMAO reductase YedYZ molybdopterin-dependent catalytic subunit